MELNEHMYNIGLAYDAIGRFCKKEEETQSGVSLRGPGWDSI